MSRGKFGLASAIAAGVLVLGFAAPASAWTVERVDLAGYAWEVEPGHGMATLRLTPPAEGPAAGAPAGAPLAMTCTAIGVGTIVVQSLDHTPPVRFGGPIQVLPRDLIEFLRLKEERRIDLPHPALYEPQVLPGDAPRTLVYSASWSPVDRLLETLARDDADAVELAVPYARMRLPVDGRDTALAAFGEACAAILAPPHH